MSHWHPIIVVIVNFLLYLIRKLNFMCMSAFCHSNEIPEAGYLRGDIGLAGSLGG
jgi:hypothetical protein